MKRFYYIITETKINRVYGGAKQKANIYTINTGKIVYCCSAEWSTSAFRGAKHEVFQSLMSNGFIPKKYEKSSVCEWRGAGYFEGEVCKKYEINELSDY